MPRVIHFEIHASRPEVLIAFYSSLFDWKFQQWGNVEYWQIETGPPDKPGINGGLVLRRGASPLDAQSVNAYICTVEVDALDEYILKAQSLGATVALPKMPIPGVGWLAYVIDPDRNTLGLMQADSSAR